ncbi:hypothetical protein HS088_TW03G01136 [Tripterygium wilfordii]|uniref:Nudix hydrolase domain-containing protein n=1 Tax=Tripterygium wilfordii TaxID=458696 RepID=A0A7J7DXG3_TRIWF|nr:nudix hydrolase 15, mitochondrial-like [Tripterygium wilfordii]KAF5750796.1 hypothetical protein HS088_TW03G01136 [Tripterygium wilfordii]
MQENVRNSPNLQTVAEQLQFYNPGSLNSKLESNDDNMFGSKCEMECNKAKDERCGCLEWRDRRAAVLICLFEGHEGELRVLLTKRSMELSSHPGDVALPGGKMEEGDADYSATALREAMEEIGLNPALIQVVANLEPFVSQHQLRVVPVVGLLDRVEEFKPILNTSEVDAIFDVPMEMFLKEDNHRFEKKEWMGWKYNLHRFDYESEQGVFLIRGLTASILIRASSLIYQRSPCFDQDLPDFQQLQRALNDQCS